MTVRELIQQLQKFPADWEAYSTKAGGSIQVWERDGAKYAYVFTDGRPPRHFTDRRPYLKKEGAR